MTPGACKSDFHREDQGFDKFKKWLLSALLARSTEAGSRTLVAGIAAGEESHGEYMADCLVAEYVALFTILSFFVRVKECKSGWWVGLKVNIANANYRTGPLVRGPEGMKLQKKVWDQLMTELEKIQPGVSSN